MDAFGTEAAFFPGWFSSQARVQQQCAAWNLPPLLASFGSSLLERAILDAACRRHGVSFAQAVRTNLFGIEAGMVHRDLQGALPREWLPARPAQRVFARQTVGLGDPLTCDEIPAADRLHDGWPQAIEEYVTRRGVRYYKVKVSNRLEEDLERLSRIARLLQAHLGRGYRLTLDGNEQYKRAEDFEALVCRLRARPDLATLWDNVLAIEQVRAGTGCSTPTIRTRPGSAGGIR
jgi:hypothetical protein